MPWSPQERLGDTRWKPNVEATALGVAQMDYGVADVAVMGVSAARHHGAILRGPPGQAPPIGSHSPNSADSRMTIVARVAGGRPVARYLLTPDSNSPFSRR